MTAPLVADEPVDVSDVTEIVGTRLEDGDWDIGVFLTDLPSRIFTLCRPLTGDGALLVPGRPGVSR